MIRLASFLVLALVVLALLCAASMLDDPLALARLGRIGALIVVTAVPLGIVVASLAVARRRGVRAPESRASR